MNEPPIANRLPIVGVMGSGTDEHRGLAEPLGRRLAELPVHLLTGGGRGVMTAVSRGFLSAPHRTGMCIGILPASGQEVARTARDGYPNPWVELTIRTHLDLSGSEGTSERSRNHINALTADCLIFLPGGSGTASEAQLAAHYQRPSIALPPFTTDLPEWIERAGDVDEAVQYVRSTLEPGKRR